MALRPVTVRLDPTAYAIIEREAAAVGQSMSMFMGTAGLARAMYEMVSRNGPGAEQLGPLYDAARQFIEAYERPPGGTHAGPELKR